MVAALQLLSVRVDTSTGESASACLGPEAPPRRFCSGTSSESLGIALRSLVKQAPLMSSFLSFVCCKLGVCSRPQSKVPALDKLVKKTSSHPVLLFLTGPWLRRTIFLAFACLCANRIASEFFGRRNGGARRGAGLLHTEEVSRRV